MRTRSAAVLPRSAGTPAEVVDRIGRYGEVGATRIYLQVLDLDDLDHLEFVATQVMPQLP
jgi:hypothetical protein